MIPRETRPVGSLRLLLALFFLCFGASFACAQSCTAPPTLTAADPVYVAVLVWGQNEAQPLGDWPDFMQQSAWGPPTLTTPDGQNLGYVLFNSYYQGISMWTKPMSERASPNLPFPNGGGADMRVRYINVGSADWTQTMGWRESITKAVQSNVLPNGQLNNTGVLYKLTDDTRHAEFGATRPFTFIIIPPYFHDYLTLALANRVEDSQSKILIHSFGGNVEPFVCGDPKLLEKYGLASGLATPDCVIRRRLPGQRRFTTLFNLLGGASGAPLSALDLYHTVGVRRVAVLNAGPSAADTYPFHGGRASVEHAENINIDALHFQTNVTCDPSSQTCVHSWPDGKTSMDVANEIKQAGVDALIFVGGSGSTVGPILSEVLSALRVVDYTPKSIYCVGGIETGLDALSPHKDTLDFALLAVPWVDTLRGPNFRSINSSINFELYPAVPGGKDSPAVWQDVFLDIGNRHAIYPQVAVLGYTALNVVQKMVERSESKHVPTILHVAASMADESPFGLINFDPAGRWSTKPQPLRQRGRLVDGKPGIGYGLTVTYPFNIGQPLLYPMPTWKERVAADPMSYNEFNSGNKVYDNAVIAVNSVLLLGALLLLALIFHFRNTSVIRSSTPWFCMLNVFGVILMLLSNYLTLTTVNDGMCAGQVWLLTLGFSITFGSLFFKTFRIWRIFGRKKLRVTKLKDTELLLYLAGFVAADLIINAVWQGVYGMPAQLVVPDRLRPALNYTECSYSGEAMGFLYAHLSLKGTLLFFGILLGYAVRNTPSAFNEATFIALAIYNVSLTAAFVIPILTAGLGGRVTVLSIRAYAIMFISLTTMAILFVPKFIKILSKDRLSGDDSGGTQMLSTKNPSGPGSSKGASGGGSGGGGSSPASPTPMSPTGTGSRAFASRPAASQQTSGPGSAYVVPMSTPIADPVRLDERSPAGERHEEREQEPEGSPLSSQDPATSEETTVQPMQPQLPGAASED